MTSTERLYYRDSYQSEFTARVVRIQQSGDVSEVVLDRTAFYPEGGGQPADLGFLDGIALSGVVDRGGEVVHLVKGQLSGEEAAGRVDWSRRFDHMQQHTGQHILSQAFERLFGAKTVSFHMGADSCTIDLATPGLDAGQVSEAEDLSNSVVFENRPVLVHFISQSDLASMELRKGTEREGEIRVVEVEGFDSIPCGGTHVRSAGEVGPIKVTRWARRSGDVRVEFLCGWRALRDYRVKNESVLTLATTLAVRDTEVKDAVDRQMKESAELRYQGEQMRRRLMDYEAAGLVAGAETAGMTALVVALLDGRTGEELKHLAGRIVAEPGRVALLASAGEKPSLVFARSEDVSLDASALLRQAAGPFGGRGGGRPNLAQGGIPDPANVQSALDEAAKMVKTQCGHSS